MANTVKRKGKSKKGPGKNFLGVLHSFHELGKEGAREDELFQKIKTSYETLDNQEKEDLFRAIVEEIEIPKEDVQPILDKLVTTDSADPEWSRLLSEFRRRTYSPRLDIFRKVSRAPGGLKFLLDFRRDLISIQPFSQTDLTPLHSDIILLFELWFQDGFLYLEEITLDSSYKQIGFIKQSDLVHPMTSIDEMGQRLGKDRRCFALYHRLIPYEPIIFIEVALTEGIARNIYDIIDVEMNRIEKQEADTAIFYSINNTQHGLAGLGLGKMLIGQVVDYVRKENEQIRNFATLSPLPGFWDDYFRPILGEKDESFILKPSDVITLFSKRQIGRILMSVGIQSEKTEGFNGALLSILSSEDWAKNEELRKDLQDPLVKIAYQYITKEKDPRNRPLNPVAGFHMGNGATVSSKNVNFLANPSSRGLKESCGIMVNYIYTPSWLSQIRRSFRWFDKLEIKGIFSRGS